MTHQLPGIREQCLLLSGVYRLEIGNTLLSAPLVLDAQWAGVTWGLGVVHQTCYHWQGSCSLSNDKKKMVGFQVSICSHFQVLTEGKARAWNVGQDDPDCNKWTSVYRGSVSATGLRTLLALGCGMTLHVGTTWSKEGETWRHLSGQRCSVEARQWLYQDHTGCSIHFSVASIHLAPWNWACVTSSCQNSVFWPLLLKHLLYLQRCIWFC